MTLAQHKSPIVEELEERLLEARSARYATWQQRGAERDAAEEGPAGAAVAAAMGVISRGGAPSGVFSASLENLLDLILDACKVGCRLPSLQGLRGTAA